MLLKSVFVEELDGIVVIPEGFENWSDHFEARKGSKEESWRKVIMSKIYLQPPALLIYEDEFPKIKDRIFEKLSATDKTDPE